MIDLTLNQNVVTELYYGIANANNSILYTKSEVPVAKTLKPVVDNDVNNNKFVTLNNYDKNRSVYQLSKNFFFDVQNGQVILSDPTTKSISVYSRTGTVLNDGYSTMTKVINTSFTTWSAYDATEAKMLLYMAVYNLTMVAIIEPDANGSYQLFNLQRFRNTGVDSGKEDGSSPTPTPTPPTPTPTPTPTPPAPTPAPTSSPSSPTSYLPDVDTISPPPTTTPPTADTMMMDYYKWYYYWVNKGIQDPNSHGLNYSDDYMLKTQIVPPVCPACSTSVGTCVKCNNAGEVSLVGGVSSDNNKDSSSVSGCSSSVPIRGNGFVSGAEKAVKGTVGLGKEVVGGTVDLGREVVGGTVGLGKEIVGGTVGLGREIAGETVELGKDIVGGTVGLGKDIVGGTIGLGKDIASGISKLGSKAEGSAAGVGGADISRSGYSNSYAGNNGQSAVVDKYSYYGAVPSKGGNFVPLTADFSKFGR
jgi:hypothetical protein